MGLWCPLLVISVNGRPGPLAWLGQVPRRPGTPLALGASPCPGPRAGSLKGNTGISPHGLAGCRDSGAQPGLCQGALPGAQVTGSWSRSLSCTAPPPPPAQGTGPSRASGPTLASLHPPPCPSGSAQARRTVRTVNIYCRQEKANTAPRARRKCPFIGAGGSCTGRMSSACGHQRDRHPGSSLSLPVKNTGATAPTPHGSVMAKQNRRDGKCAATTYPGGPGPQ